VVKKNTWLLLYSGRCLLRPGSSLCLALIWLFACVYVAAIIVVIVIVIVGAAAIVEELLGIVIIEYSRGFVDLESIYAWDIGIGGFLGDNLRESGKEEMGKRGAKISAVDVAMS